MGWWTTDQVKCNQRAGALVSYGTDANLPQLDKMHEMVTQTHSDVQLQEHNGIQHFDRNLTIIKNSHGWYKD